VVRSLRLACVCGDRSRISQTSLPEVLIGTSTTAGKGLWGRVLEEAETLMVDTSQSTSAAPIESSPRHCRPSHPILDHDHRDHYNALKSNPRYFDPDIYSFKQYFGGGRVATM
jgi:hypothetical protein